VGRVMELMLGFDELQRIYRVIAYLDAEDAVDS